jgi:3-mercaptopyruvate sulfurtransferase SseA
MLNMPPPVACTPFSRFVRISCAVGLLKLQPKNAWTDFQINKTSIDCVFADPGRNAVREFQKERIPGSLRFDIDAVADQSKRLPHMVPTPEVFAAAVGVASIGPDDLVVVYDRLGNFSSPRAWWTFKVLGHDRCLFCPLSGMHTLNGAPS